MYRVTVVHVVNGTTRTDIFELDAKPSCQISQGFGIVDMGSVVVIYRTAERIEREELRG